MRHYDVKKITKYLHIFLYNKPRLYAFRYFPVLSSICFEISWASLSSIISTVRTFNGRIIACA